MNLQTRIKKIEERARVSEFCACANDPRYPRTETVYYEDGKPATDPQFLAGQLPPLPDVCPNCRRPIHKMTMIIDFVSSNIPKPEDAE